MRPADPNLSLCVRHLQAREQQEAAARTGDEIVGAEGALNTPDGIHKALANVFSNLAGCPILCVVSKGWGIHFLSSSRGGRSSGFSP
jgi:hypothetical protein